MTANFSGQSRLSQCEQRGRQRSDTSSLKGTTRLQTFPSTWDLDAYSGCVEIRIHASE